jgi:hypothetical protein
MENGMDSPWRTIKWIAYVLLTGVVLKVAKSLLDTNKSSTSWFDAVRTVPHEHPYQVSIVLGSAIILGLVWLFADRKELVEQLDAQVSLFAKSELLSPDDLSIYKFDDYYQPTSASVQAEQELLVKGRVLILGRPAGGKTRLAFNLAHQLRNHRILRTRADFNNWELLKFPRIPARCKVIWVIDNVDQFVGRLDIKRALRSLEKRCVLKVIVTCRQGRELEAVLADEDLHTFIEQLHPSRSCEGWDVTFCSLSSLVFAISCSPPAHPKKRTGAPS